MALALPRLVAAALPSPRFITVWQRHRDVFRHLWVNQALLPIVEPIITLLVLGFGLGQFVDLGNGQDYIAFIAPGMMAAFPMWQAVFVCSWGAWIRMETQQSYQSMIATPLEPEDVAAGEIAWGTTMSLISTFYVLIMIAALGLVHSPLVLLMPPVAVMHGVLLASMALAYTASIKTASAMEYFFTIGVIPMFWFGDIFFPRDRLPEGLQVAGWFVPTSHTVAIYRGLLSGNAGPSLFGHFLWLLVVGTALFLLALHRVRRRLIR